MHRKIVAPMTVLFVTEEVTIPEVGAYGKKLGSEITAEAEKHGVLIEGADVGRIPTVGVRRTLGPTSTSPPLPRR